MGGVSWMDELAGHHFDCYALDFLGYGYADRYPDKPLDSPVSQAPGRAAQVCWDIDSAVNFILKRTGSKKINIIAHSWGGTGGAFTYQLFQHDPTGTGRSHAAGDAGRGSLSAGARTGIIVAKTMDGFGPAGRHRPQRKGFISNGADAGYRRDGAWKMLLRRFAYYLQDFDRPGRMG